MSTVTEGLMTAGSFTIELDDSAPRSIVEGLTEFSWVCVTPGRETAMSADEVFESAVFSGMLRRKSRNLCVLEGPSLVALLGDEDNKNCPVPDVDGTVSGDAMIADLFGFPTYTGGLTLGTTASLPATPVWAASVGGYYRETSRQFLDRVCRFLDWQYRVNADRTVDIEQRGSIFRTTPSVLVLADHLGEPVSDVIRLVVNGQIDATSHWDDFSNLVVVTDGTYSGLSTTSRPFYRGPDASTVLNQTKWISTSDLGSDANAIVQANTEVVTNYADKKDVSVSIALDDPRQRIEPGDTIHVYDPLQDLYDTDNQVNLMGQCVFPVELVVSEMTWPVTEGMGVYCVLNGTDEIVRDLSEFVLWGSGDTRLTVGAKPTKLREVIFGKN